jgi:hypothetical protein
MKRRPAVTLMEVLVAMFIMAIGMMALMALFPVGAVSMAQALKDDRCAYAANMAQNVAIVNNIRYGDANVALVLNNPVLAPQGFVYVDPYGAAFGLAPIGFGVVPVTATTAPIPRVRPSFVGNSMQLIDRWFSLPDDIGYTKSGTADISNTGGIIDRGRRYSFAYLLRQSPPATASNPIQPLKAVQLFAVVYAGRPVNTLAPETTYAATGAAGGNGIVVSATATTIKRGGWILDPVNGYFYRVTNLAEFGATATTVEVQQNLIAPVTFVTVMDYVAEVFDKGFGWQQ